MTLLALARCMFVNVVAVIAVLANLTSPATDREFAVPVVSDTAGLPLEPVAVFVFPSGADWSTPVNEPLATRMPSVAPVTVTDRVLAPVVGLMRYHISPAILLERKEAIAWVKPVPLYVIELTVPVPPTSCQIPTQTTNRVLTPVTVCE